MFTKCLGGENLERFCRVSPKRVCGTWNIQTMRATGKIILQGFVTS